MIHPQMSSIKTSVAVNDSSSSINYQDIPIGVLINYGNNCEVWKGRFEILPRFKCIARRNL